LPLKKSKDPCNPKQSSSHINDSILCPIAAILGYVWMEGFGGERAYFSLLNY